VASSEPLWHAACYLTCRSFRVAGGIEDRHDDQTFWRNHDFDFGAVRRRRSPRASARTNRKRPINHRISRRISLRHKGKCSNPRRRPRRPARPIESQDQSQPQSQGQPQAQPGVARISMIRGDASTQRGDSGDWSAATVNQPLEAGDKISTGANAQAEVQLDFADILRLDQHAQANITALGNQQIQVQVAQGLVNFSIFKHSESDVEIDTPNVAVHPSQDEGSFRILVLSDTETQVIVRNGQAEISTPQGSTHVTKGQLITIRRHGRRTRSTKSLTRPTRIRVRRLERIAAINRFKTRKAGSTPIPITSARKISTTMVQLG
jgi:hypothetical protein